MKALDKVISSKMESLFVQKVMSEKGWSKQETANHLVGFVICGEKISLAAYLNKQS